MNSTMGRSPIIAAPMPMTGKARLGDRRVDDAALAEFLQHAPAHLVGAVVLRDFLTHEEDTLVTSHLLAHGLAEGIAELDDAGGPAHSGHGFVSFEGFMISGWDVPV